MVAALPAPRPPQRCTQAGNSINTTCTRRCLSSGPPPPSPAPAAAHGNAEEAALTALAAAIRTHRPEFYKRDLPPSCIAFSSAEGKSLFREALGEGTMECYFPLAAQFRTQDEPAYCGLSTLVMTLNALSIDPRRPWKGPWRWFSEDMLECCMSMELIKEKGIDLDTFACLARCNAAAADVTRPPSPARFETPAGRAEYVAQEAEFREVVQQLSRRSEDEFLVLSYSRRALGQTGLGHFSPLGGYHKGRDMLLILDVARFKYPPHWVPVSDMWRAMMDVDTETSRPRGYVRLRRLASAPLMLFHLNTLQTAPATPTRTCLNRRLYTALDSALKACKLALAAGTVRHHDTPRETNDTALRKSVELFVRCFHNSSTSIGAMPSEAAQNCVDKLSREHITTTTSFIREIESNALFPLVSKALRAVEKDDVPIGRTRGHHSHNHDHAHAKGPCGDHAVLLRSSKDTATPAATAATTNSLASSTAPSASAAPASHVCGVTCVRIGRDHVMTMLLLSWAYDANRAACMLPNAAAGSAEAHTAYTGILLDAVAGSLSHASPLLREEIELIHEQLQTSGTSLA